MRKSWVLGGVYFLDGGHDGDSDKMSEQGRLSIEICLQRTGRTEENLVGKRFILRKFEIQTNHTLQRTIDFLPKLWNTSLRESRSGPV